MICLAPLGEITNQELKNKTMEYATSFGANGRPSFNSYFETMPFIKEITEMCQKLYNVCMLNILNISSHQQKHFLSLFLVLSSGDQSHYNFFSITDGEKEIFSHMIFVDIKIIYEVIALLACSPNHNSESGLGTAISTIKLSAVSRLLNLNDPKLNILLAGITSGLCSDHKSNFLMSRSFEDIVSESSITPEITKSISYLCLSLIIFHEMTHLIFKISSKHKKFAEREMRKLIKLSYTMKKHFEDSHHEFSSEIYFSELNSMEFDDYAKIISKSDLEEMVCDRESYLSTLAYFDSRDRLDDELGFQLRLVYRALIDLSLNFSRYKSFYKHVSENILTSDMSSEEIELKKHNAQNTEESNQKLLSKISSISLARISVLTVHFDVATVGYIGESYEQCLRATYFDQSKSQSEFTQTLFSRIDSDFFNEEIMVQNITRGNVLSNVLGNFEKSLNANLNSDPFLGILFPNPLTNNVTV